MSWILGIVSTCLTVILLVVANRLDFPIQTYTVFFVVPLGAAVSGMGCASGLFGWLFFRNIRPSPLHRAGGLGLGALGFVLLYFVLAALSGPGQPFLPTLVEVISNRTIEVRVHGAPVVGGEHRPRQRGEDFVWSWLLFALEGVGFVAGAWIVADKILGEREICTRCHQEMQQIEFGKLPLEDVAARRTEIQGAQGDAAGMRSLVEREVACFQSQPGDHVEMVLAVCRTCGGGSVLLKQMRYTKDGLKEKVRKRQSLPLEPNAAQAGLAALRKPSAA
jgi:hypothetical protein